MANPNTSLIEDLLEEEKAGNPPAAEEAIAGNEQQDQQQSQQTAQQPDDFNKRLEELTSGKVKSVEEITQLLERPNVEELKFANETSQKIFEYLKEGKIDEFFDVFQEQRQLESIDKLQPDDILKLKMKKDNPDLTDDEIEEEFSFKYGVQEPDIDENLDTPEEIAKEKKRYEREKLNMERLKKKDMKEAKEFLNTKKQEIVLPDLPKREAQQSQQTDEADEQAVREFRDKYLQKIPAAIEGIGGFETKYKDGEIEFNANYVIDANEKTALKQQLEKFTLQDYFLPRYIDESGDFKTEAIARDLYLLENFNKIVESQVSQAVNQARANFVKGLKNADYQEGTRRQLPDEQQANYDKMVDTFFGNT